MKKTLGDLAMRMGAELRGGASAETPFTGFALDNREVQSGQVFLAIRGANVDGHQYVGDAFAAGAVAAVCERPVEGPHLLVPNLVEALATFARSLREEFTGTVVGITGSNGKTSAKEFTAAALGAGLRVLKSPGNRNTEYTAPLLWQDAAGHEVVVAELAMRGFNQIDHLARFTQPTIGLITMIGTAHIEMVGSREGIARAKGEIIPHIRYGGHLVLWAEDDFTPHFRTQSSVSISTFGTTTDADCRVIGYRALDWQRSEVIGEIFGTPWRAELTTIGKHQALNAAAGILVAHLAGVPVDAAAQALGTAQLPPMRMEILERGGLTLALDNYNASPDSTAAALRTLAEAPSQGRRVAVLGEMKELGEFSEIGHRLVGKAVAATAPDRVLFFGDQARIMMEEAVGLGFPSSQSEWTDDLAQVTQWLKGLAAGDAVLIKGSRALGLERALEDL